MILTNRDLHYKMRKILRNKIGSMGYFRNGRFDISYYVINVMAIIDCQLDRI